MARNTIIKIFKNDATWTAPGGVTKVKAVMRQSNLHHIGYINQGYCAIDSAGDAYAWGDNLSGQLGDNTTIDRSSPVLVVGGKKWLLIGGGSSTQCGVDTNNDAYGWGRNTFEELGDGSTTSRSTPILIFAGMKAKDIAIGNTSSLGITLDGTPYGWGFNGSGEVGDNSTTNRNTPTAVVGGLKFIQISKDTSSSAYGLTSTGDIYAWGSNTVGQLGDNTTANKSSPVLVVGGLKFVKVMGMSGNAYGLTASGDIYAWGDNTSGMLGDNTTANKSSPVLVVGGKDWSYLSNGGNLAMLAIDTAGNAYSWGSNTAGQLGDNTTINRSSPVAVVGGLKFVQVSHGTNSSAGLTINGDIYTWGSNAQGELGTNSATTTSSPVLVVGSKIWDANYESKINEIEFDVVPGTSYSISVGNGSQITFNHISLGFIRQASAYLTLEYQA